MTSNPVSAALTSRVYDARRALRRARPDDLSKSGAALAAALEAALEAAPATGAGARDELLQKAIAVLGERRLRGLPEAQEALAMAAARAPAPVAAAAREAAVEAAHANPAGPSARARRQLALAAEREELFSHGERLTLASLAFPAAPEPLLALLPGTSFKTTKAAKTYLRRILREEGSPHRVPALVALLGALTAEQCREIYALDEGLRGPGGPGPLALALLDHAAAHHRATHSELLERLRGAFGEDAEPLVAWVIAHGHPWALPGALRGLEAWSAEGTPPTLECAPALALAAEHPDPALAARAAALLSLAEATRRPPRAGPIPDALRARLGRRTPQDGWTWAERHRVYQAWAHLKDTAPAPPQLQHTLLQIARARFDAERGPTAGEPPPRAHYLEISLALCGAPAFMEHPDALPLLLDAVEGGRGAGVRQAATRALASRRAAGAPPLTPAQRARVAAACARPGWTLSALRSLAPVGAPEADGCLAELVARSGGAAEAQALHRMLLSGPGSAPWCAALEALYRGQEDPVVRGLLEQIGPEAAPGYLPAWLALARTAVPSTRRAAVAAIGRLGAAGEPALIERLQEDPDPAVGAAAVAALEAAGTRGALEALGKAGRALAPAARRAAGAIRARYPAAEGAAGALSVASPGEAGAVSLARGAAGALSLEASSPRPPAAPPASAAPPARSDPDLWASLAAAPRRIPISLPAVLLLREVTDTAGVLTLAGPFLIAAALGCAGLPLTQLLGGEPFSPVAWLISAATVSLCGLSLAGLARSARQEIRFLRHALPSRAALVQREVREQTIRRGRQRPLEVTQHRYHFDVLCEDGRLRRHSLPWGERRGELESPEGEPVLYRPGPDGGVRELRFCDQLPQLAVGPGGALRIRPRALLKAALLALWLGWLPALMLLTLVLDVLG